MTNSHMTHHYPTYQQMHTSNNIPQYQMQSSNSMQMMPVTYSLPPQNPQTYPQTASNNSQPIQYVHNGNWATEQLNFPISQQSVEDPNLQNKTDDKNILNKNATKKSIDGIKLDAPIKPKNVYRHLCPECDKP